MVAGEAMSLRLPKGPLTAAAARPHCRQGRRGDD